MKKKLVTFIIAGLLVSPVFAKSDQIELHENSFFYIAKSTFYGALFGTILSVAVMLVTDDDDGDIFRVGFVSGTALGLVLGVYGANSGVPVRAALNINGDQVQVSWPSLRFSTYRNSIVASLVSVSF